MLFSHEKMLFSHRGGACRVQMFILTAPFPSPVAASLLPFYSSLDRGNGKISRIKR